jgi:hypothetical protein
MKLQLYNCAAKISGIKQTNLSKLIWISPEITLTVCLKRRRRGKENGERV